jgi:uncharacterized RDD family membrane protein YckC
MRQTQPAVTLTPAPLILRFAAVFIDVVILVVIGFALIAATDPDSFDKQEVSQSTYALGIIMSAVYNIGFLATISATPGKLAMGLYVADKQGARIRPDTAILRHVVFLIGNSIVIGLVASVFLLFIDQAHRTVHDRVSGTIVLRRPQGTELPPPDLS